MDLSELPVTLVIKAPNHKIADQTVECALDWSIRKLKQHLTTVYPSTPKSNQQRIIYSGKLLQDDLVLKDVLRQYEPNQTTHIVHLVCSNLGDGNTNSDSDKNPTVNSASQNATRPEDSNGIRHRNVPSSSNENNSSSPQTSTSSETISADTSNYHGAQIPTSHGHAYAGMADVGMHNVPMMPGMAYSPEQIMWMQQMYAQQMAQYMQFFSGGAAPFINPVFPTHGGIPDGGAAMPGMANAEAPPAARPRPVGQQPVRMNAQGGAWMDDEDEEGMQRDWLDWVYTLSRFSVLLSIVYFYSSVSRFIMVFGFFFFVYLYQGGWLRGRRNPAPAEEEGPAEPAADPQQPAQNAAEPSPEEQQQQEDSESETSREEEQVAPAEPAPPGTRAVAWAFLSSFFTSLIPQQPVAVNGN